MADTLLWRPIPILTLTVRQFLGGRALWVVTAFSFIPCVFAAIYLLNTSVNTPRGFLVNVIFLNLVAPTLLPIAVLILATGALGNEVEDRSLPYLVLKPITRLRIVVEKLAGILVVAVPAILAGLIVTWLMVKIGAGSPESGGIVFGRTDPADYEIVDVLWAMLGAATVGIVATAALFLLVSLIIPRALLVGIIYAFAWESLLGRFLPGINVVSIRHYTISVFIALLDHPESTVNADLRKEATSLNTALTTVAVLVVVSIALTTWRLRTMNLE
jgi:ABC-2 type transport system permease protein